MSTIVTNNCNEVLVCGRNTSGQLGLNHVINTNFFTKLDYLPEITAVCYYDHTVLLDVNGKIWVCGNNKDGQLGLGDTNNRKVFECINGLPMIKSISCCHNHTLLIDFECKVWVCGYNFNGQLGLGDNKNRTTFEVINDLPPIKISACSRFSSYLIDIYGNVLWSGCYGNISNKLYFSQIPNIQHIKDIKSGEEHVILLDENDEILVCGINYDCRLGIGKYKNADEFTKLLYEIPKIKMISCGFNHSLLLDLNNKIWTCGRTRNISIQEPSDTLMYFTYIPTDNLPKIKSIRANINCNLLVDINNNLWLHGINVNGQLGTGDFEDRNEFIMGHNMENITLYPIIHSYPKNARNSSFICD